MSNISKTTLDMDKDLINEVMSISGEKTIKGAVDVALTEFVMARKKQQLLAARGTFEFDPEYDYKEDRKKW